MSFTPFQAPVLAGLLGDGEIASHFSVSAELAAMVRFETALARAEAASGVIPKAAADAIAAACETFEPDIKAIGQGAARDGVAVPEFVRQLRAAVGEPHAGHVHFGATSQDVVDTALMLRLRPVIAILLDRLAQLDDALGALDGAFGSTPLMARTRMQSALSVTVGHRISTWREPLRDRRAALEELQPHLLRLQLGGPVGTRETLGDRAREVVRAMAAELDLSPSPHPWHTDRARLSEFSTLIAATTATLGKIGADVALMSQDERAEIRLSAAGGSSAIPHKRNPVLAETLVALARFCAVQAGGILQAQPHEQERSGWAWTLEWLLLPQLCVAAGAASRNTLLLLGQVEAMGTLEQP